ncbi:hypothetical protein BJV78DRAFT_1352586 [Lactifluus subvellereus]|nr:hypothetical protein BJV78DRAFT_1352586 [Lactifluus subvellereus]
MLTGASPFPIQRRPTTADFLFSSEVSTPSPPITRSLRYNHFFQSPAKSLDNWSAGAPRSRIFSMASNTKSSLKGKERDALLDSGSFTSSLAFDDMVTFSNKPARGLSFSRPATADPPTSGQRRQRGSILGVASDALRFGRRRRSIKTPPPPPQPRLLLQEVIEVRGSAPTPTFDEDEEAEREQLRAAAVQSVGFDVDISRPPDREHTAFGDEGDMNEGTGHVLHANGHENGRSSPPVLPHSLPSIVDNTISDAPGSPYTVRVRTSHSPVRAAQPASALTSSSTKIPEFPSTRAQVSRHEQLSATLPKHYPPPSLLMLALSKQWRSRHVVLSAPVLAGASYLHVFKSPAADEPELERLEINERSVVFITDDNVGGRRGVVRVGGVDVGALRRELNSEENGLTIMMLQIMDANASQSWINAIKNAVLGQRSVRAGLGIPSNPSGVPEPRGDLDVMLSMRMQGMLPSPAKPSSNLPDEPEDTNKILHIGPSGEGVSSPKPPSLRSRPVTPRSPTGVLSLKSLFSVSGSGSARPRSPSLARATSPDAASSKSLGSAASSLLSMRTVADSPLIKPYSMLPPTGPGLDTTVQMPRKIIDTQSNLDWSPLESSSKSAVTILPPHRPMSPSLNPPPPRKRAYTTNEHRTSTSPDIGWLVYNHGNASSAGSFGVPVPQPIRPRLERASSERSKPRTGSVSSTSTTTENGSARRWSRQSSSLPTFTPVSDSSISTAAGSQPPSWQNGPQQVLPSHASERSPSPSSPSQRTLPSIISSLHVSSKRASASGSLYSVSTTSSSAHPFSLARSPGSGHRLSVPPPPRPAPSTALPPTPSGSDTEAPIAAPTATVKVRRNSLARRALRLSLGPPAPSTQVHPQVLPDANSGTGTRPASRSHSRSTSVDSVPRSNSSHGHVISSALLDPPTPPPTCPLPPPPPSPPSPSTPTPASPRTTTFKQRLRILGTSGRSTPPPPAISTAVPPTLSTLEIPSSLPVTPIGERIAHISPDADFLHLGGDTPVATTPWSALGMTSQLLEGVDDTSPVLSRLTIPSPPLLPPRSPYRPAPSPAAPDRSPQQMTVLSPPPRKGSMRPLPSPSPEQERGPSVARDGDDVLRLTPPPLDLARNTSTLSLSIVSGAV